MTEVERLLLEEVRAARRENGEEFSEVKTQMGEVVTQVAVLGERVLAHCSDDSKHVFPKRPCETAIALKAVVDRHLGRHWLLFTILIVALLGLIADLALKVFGG